MNIDDIKTKYANLSAELKDALARMQLTDRVITIKNAINDLQNMCPHNNGSFDFSTTDYCPYCGKNFRK